MVQPPEAIPGEFGPGRDKRFLGRIGLGDEMRRVRLLVGDRREKIAGCLAVLQSPPKERRQFFAASSTNSVSVSLTFAIA